MPINFPQEEEKILEFWKQNKIFEKSLAKNSKRFWGKKEFVFYDGPPFATGTPHYGHLLQSAVKDVIPRYKTMQGFYVPRQWGWDCHGLPIENIVEKELGTKTKKEILEMGVKKFNDLCREKLFTFIHEWEKIIPRFGRWVDMEHPYRTMDFEYMSAEWWAFKELYNKGLIYEGYRSMHICPRCETTLSQGEVADGYKNIKDLSATPKFKVIGQDKTYFLAWTTTPWTLIGNVALAVGEKINYVKAKIDQEFYILAKNRIEAVLAGKQYEIVEEFLGSKLVGLEYEPLFNFYIRSGKVCVGDFVTTEDGTGIVHIAPAFGADDMELGKKKDLPFVQHVKMDGTFKPETEVYAGLDLKPRAKDKPEEIREADLTIVKDLEKNGLLFAYEKYEHSYPHCWRCDTALLNYATSSWFVAVEKIKPKLLKLAKKINWSPEHIKEGRFGQWLQGARDWSISRQRFWANTIPVWRCDKCRKEMVFGSAQELEKVSRVKVTDLHKDFVDQIYFDCSCGGKFMRVPDVLDTWFDSGSVPFATNRNIPADFIGEAQDQTRAWFYYQHVLVGSLFEKQAFKNCIVTGIVLAEDGKKMSKKLKNYPDPVDMINKYGADAMRFYMLSSPVVQADNLSFSEKGVDEIVKKNVSRLYNVLEFYKLYAGEISTESKSNNVLDKWIISRLNNLLKTTTQEYDSYRIDTAIRPLTEFIDDFSVWYLRRSRERFKEEGEDKAHALATLRHVLKHLAMVMAPVMPFSAENIYQGIKSQNDNESVHLCCWPKISGELIDKKLEEKMAEARNIVNMALAERIANGIKVKQPLALLIVKNANLQLKGDEKILQIVKDEINVKKIVFDSNIVKDVELDTNITEELKEEGLLRELVREVQAERKVQNLIPQDRITVEILVLEKEKEIIEKNIQNLKKEFRADRITTLIHSEKERKIKINRV